MTGQGVGGIAGEINFEATAGGVGSSSNYGATAWERSGGGVLGLESPAAASAHVGGAGEGATGFGAPLTLSASAAYGGAVGESVSTYGAGATSRTGFSPLLHQLYSMLLTATKMVLFPKENSMELDTKEYVKKLLV